MQSERCPWCGSPISREKFLEIEGRIRQEERKRLADAEAAMRTSLEQQFKRKFEAEKKQSMEEADIKITALTKQVGQSADREAKVRKQAKEETERNAKKLLAERDREHRKELQSQREILVKDSDQKVLKVRVEFNREREAHQKKLKELERQLERKTAHEVGDGAEIDLYEALREAFPDDRIVRIRKGQPGADIVHEVVYKGDVCARIVYDSKNRKAWQSAFVTKLRDDQVNEEAEHAVLATTVFPAGKKELCVERGVIIVNPARAVPVVALLRTAMVRLHVLGLSTKERAGKMSRLYSFITSEAYAQRFGELGKVTDQLLDLDVEEQREHQRVWKNRGTLVTRQKHLLRELDTEISAVVEQTAEFDFVSKEVEELSVAESEVDGSAAEIPF